MHNLPQALTLNLTSSCNLSCSYCYQDKLNSGNKMSDEVIDKFAKMVNTAANTGFTITFFGGEPTLATRAMDRIIEKVNIDKVHTYHIITNGTNVKPVNELAKKVSDMSNGRITLGAKFSNKESGNPDKDFNHDQIESMYRFVLDVENITSFNEQVVTDLLESNFNNINVTFNAYDDWSVVSDNEVMRVIEMLDAFVSATGRIKYQPPTLSKPKAMKKCPIPQLTLDTNGDILPCHRMTNASRGEGQALGNILVDADAALAELRRFHSQQHVGTSCIGFTPNFGKDSNLYVLDLAATAINEVGDSSNELQAAIANTSLQDCR